MYRTRALRDILEEHWEELQSLWSQRSSAQHDPAYLPRDLADLDERIEAHCDALLIGSQTAAAIYEAGLTSEDAVVVSATAELLLRSNDPTATQRILTAFEQTQGKVLAGLTDVLSRGADQLLAGVHAIYQRGPAPAAATAAEVLARRGRLQSNAARLDEFLAHDEPMVRQTAWRIVALVDRRKAI